MAFRQAGWVLILGSVAGFVAGLVHVSGRLRLFGEQGIVLPGWEVMLLAPLAFLAGFVCLAWGAAAERRRDARLRARRQRRG